MDFSEYLTNILSAEPKKTTKAGKPVSHYTMLCYFRPGGKQYKWLYRGDNYLKECRALGNNAVSNELEALLFKHNTIKEMVISCKIFNNYNPPKQQMIFCEYSDGTIPVNLLAQELKKLRNEKNDQFKIHKQSRD